MDIAELRNNTFNYLESVQNLPSMPVVLAEVNSLLSDESTSASELSEVISKDQGLVTKVLTVANSPFYGIPRRVSTIEFAIVILGFNHIKNIVIALSMMEAFKSVTGKKFQQKEYWMHSVITGFLAKRLADDLGYAFSGEAFTSGLLHDLGLPLIYKLFQEEFEKIVGEAKNGDSTYQELELKYFGATHGEIGAFLIDKWNLPESLSEAVRFHHSPDRENVYRELTAIVHLADYMLNKMELANYFWDNDIGLDNSVLTTLKLGGEEYLNNLIEKYEPLIGEQLENFIF